MLSERGNGERGLSFCRHVCLFSALSVSITRLLTSVPRSRCRRLLPVLGCVSAWKAAVFPSMGALIAPTDSCVLVWVGGRQLAGCVLFFQVSLGMVGLSLVCASLLWPHQWLSQTVLRKWTDRTDSAALSSGYDLCKTHTHTRKCTLS